MFQNHMWLWNMFMWNFCKGGSHVWSKRNTPGSNAWNREASARTRKSFLFLALASHVWTRLNPLKLKVTLGWHKGFKVGSIKASGQWGDEKALFGLAFNTFSSGTSYWGEIRQILTPLASLRHVLGRLAKVFCIIETTCVVPNSYFLRLFNWNFLSETNIRRMVWNWNKRNSKDRRSTHGVAESISTSSRRVCKAVA